MAMHKPNNVRAACAIDFNALLTCVFRPTSRHLAQRHRRSRKPWQLPREPGLSLSCDMPWISRSRTEAMSCSPDVAFRRMSTVLIEKAAAKTASSFDLGDA
jgi:hypothetical protein